jgi:hypothetical protein
MTKHSQSSQPPRLCRDERRQTEVLERHRPAWAHKDSDGFSLKLDYLPLIPGAQIVQRKPKAEEAKAPRRR